MTTDDLNTPNETPEPEISPESTHDETPESGVEVGPPADSAPLSAAPPRIVGETPVGGIPRLRPLIRPEPEPTSEPPSAAPLEAEAAAPVEPEPSPEPSVTVETVSTHTPEPEISEAAEPAPAPMPEPTPSKVSAVPTPEPAPLETADDWDDDISPELAQVLFTARQKTEAAVSAPPEARPTPARTAPAATDTIHLIDIASVRALPITAQGDSAPAPDPRPEGKARYERVEEPLPDDKGQRTSETWDYMGPGRPVLHGREIKRVAVQETTYADGSWHWVFERRYSDGSRERREVRANTDHTYIERTDEIDARNPTTKQRRRHKEEEAMILAGPPREGKRGLLSRLLGRHELTESEHKAWRVAESDEKRRARKQGGDAF